MNKKKRRVLALDSHGNTSDTLKFSLGDNWKTFHTHVMCSISQRTIPIWVQNLITLILPLANLFDDSLIITTSKYWWLFYCLIMCFSFTINWTCQIIKLWRIQFTLTVYAKSNNWLQMKFAFWGYLLFIVLT